MTFCVLGRVDAVSQDMLCAQHVWTVWARNPGRSFPSACTVQVQVLSRRGPSPYATPQHSFNVDGMCETVRENPPLNG